MAGGRSLIQLTLPGGLPAGEAEAAWRMVILPLGNPRKWD